MTPTRWTAVALSALFVATVLRVDGSGVMLFGIPYFPTLQRAVYCLLTPILLGYLIWLAPAATVDRR